uniref:TFIIS-type domain-containing protein n=1 Tax=Panthera leo TaxID=9689 RepID=A0A8C8XE33_PANLE
MGNLRNKTVGLRRAQCQYPEAARAVDALHGSRPPGQHRYQFACDTCPYMHITGKVKNRRNPKLKSAEDMRVEQLPGRMLTLLQSHPNCEHPCAYFVQLQTHSADKLVTTFYKCYDARWGVGEVKWVMGTKEGTCCDDHRVMYGR